MVIKVGKTFPPVLLLSEERDLETNKNTVLRSLPLHSPQLNANFSEAIHCGLGEVNSLFPRQLLIYKIGVDCSCPLRLDGGIDKTRWPRFDIAMPNPLGQLAGLGMDK